MDIPSIIKQALNNKTLTQLAKEMGLSHSTLSLIKNKHRPAGGKVMKALLRHPDTRKRMLFYLEKNVSVVNINGNEGKQ
jgi:transcriptional regulator with XRE-family HTH domain